MSTTSVQDIVANICVVVMCHRVISNVDAAQVMRSKPQVLTSHKNYRYSLKEKSRLATMLYCWVINAQAHHWGVPKSHIVTKRNWSSTTYTNGTGTQNDAVSGIGSYASTCMRVCISERWLCLPSHVHQSKQVVEVVLRNADFFQNGSPAMAFHVPSVHVNTHHAYGGAIAEGMYMSAWSYHASLLGGFCKRLRRRLPAPVFKPSTS